MTNNLPPNPTPWDYEALKESIRRWGVILPIVQDEEGSILDSHQQVRACQELGIENYAELTLAGLTDEEKQEIINLLRRRLNQ
jgi:ParB-like chromosome segregation protein Spo0J